MKAKHGQIVLFMLMVIAALAILALLNVDTFIAMRARMNVENGGDAAALAAARRQGSLINEIGRLNIEHIKYAIETNKDLMAEMEAKIAETVLTQRRRTLIGPINALVLANEAAKANNMPAVKDFSQILKEHINDILSIYMGQVDQGDPYPEPYEGAWREYAAAILNAIEGGLHVGADNIEFHNGNSGAHYLLNMQFYNAVAGRNWCWFHFYANRLLDDYTNFNDWAPLPTSEDRKLDNCEIFPLHLKSVTGAFTDFFSEEEIFAILEKHLGITREYLEEADMDISDTLLADPEQTWFFFDETRWCPWFSGSTLLGEGIANFPILGSVKGQYNVRGAAAITRTLRRVSPVMAGDCNYSWSAAAKPFGTLDALDGSGTGPVTGANCFVLPCMTDARLVPVDTVGGSYLATADINWVRHIRKHLPRYMQNGPYSVPSDCWYCDRLREWENPMLRARGRFWLKYNSDKCVRGCGSDNDYGGTSHGH